MLVLCVTFVSVQFAAYYVNTEIKCSSFPWISLCSSNITSELVPSLVGNAAHWTTCWLVHVYFKVVHILVGKSYIYIFLLVT